MNPKFSIIIPVYNVASYLRECLDSVLAQTVNDPASPNYAAASWEAICVDDGSTDGSAAILDEYGERDVRIRVFHQANQGVSAARNAAIEAAGGNWVLFLDGDDLFHNQAISIIARIIKDNSDIDVVKFRYQHFVGFSHQKRIDSIRDELVDISQSLERIPSNGFFAFAYRRAIIQDVRFGNQMMGEDVLYMFRSLMRAKRMAIIENVLYLYRDRPGSAMLSKMTERKLLDKIDVANQICKLYVFGGKLFSRAQRRARCNDLLEMIPSEWKGFRKGVLLPWKKALEIIAEHPEFFGWQAYRARLVKAIPYLVGPLGVFPRFIKINVWHR